MIVYPLSMTNMSIMNDSSTISNNINNNSINNNNNVSINNHHTSQDQTTQSSIVTTTNNSSEKIRWNDDFFSTLTLEECEKNFEEHYENNIAQFSSSKDKLSLLRSCVELLNRLECTSHHLFAGRVLIFLAKVLPFFDQSGLNSRSEFSVKELPEAVVENLNQISSQTTASEKNSTQPIDTDMEEGETISDDESNDGIPRVDNDKIYERFWKTQNLLYQPNLLYDKNNCYAFRTCVDTLLCNMELKPAHLKVWKLRNSYMSSPKALSLQLSDVNMRRCFLVQILIVIQYLDLPLDTKPENFVLDKVQQAWFSSTTKRIYTLLDTMPNQDEGRRFLGLVRHLLRREEMWSRWKVDKCKEFKLAENADDFVNMRGTYFKRRKISDELTAAKSYNMHVIGSQDMSRLWNMKPSEKFNKPDLDKYLNIPDDKQEESYKDPNYSFRILRLLRKSPHFFVQTSVAVGSLEEYLKNVAMKHANKVET